MPFFSDDFLFVFVLDKNSFLELYLEGLKGFWNYNLRVVFAFLYLMILLILIFLIILPVTICY